MSILGIRHRQLNKCRSIDIDLGPYVLKWSIDRPSWSKKCQKSVNRPSMSMSMSTVAIDSWCRWFGHHWSSGASSPVKAPLSHTNFIRRYKGDCTVVGNSGPLQLSFRSDNGYPLLWCERHLPAVGQRVKDHSNAVVHMYWVVSRNNNM